MDLDLELARRAFRSAPDDVHLAIRVASSLERSGRFHDAWDELASFLARVSNKERARSLRVVLAEMARREPALVVERIRGAKPARAKLLVEALASENEVAPLVALAFDGRVAGMRALALTNLARTLVRVLEDVPPIDELPLLDQRSPYGCDCCPGLRGDHPSWAARRLARRLARPVALAREKRLVAFLPWLWAIAQTSCRPLADDAREAFFALAKAKRPPIDVRVLAHSTCGRA